MKSIQIRRPRISLSGILIAALCLMLPILAVLQYRWIGEVSRAERERLATGLSVSSDRFADDLSREIANLAVSFEVWTVGDITDLAAQLSRDFERWTRTSRYPEIVKAVYVVVPRPGNTAAVSRFDPESNALEIMSWPGQLEPIGNRAGPRAAGRGRPGLREPLEGLLPPEALKASLWLLAPASPPGLFATRNGPGTLNVRTLIEIDPDALAEVLLPDMVGAHFDLNSYRVAIFESPASDAVVFASEPGLTRPDLSPSDASFNPFETGPPGAGAMPVTWPPQRGRGLRTPPPPFGQTENGRVRRGGAPINRAPLVLAGARWQLLAQHRLGSLEDAVSLARRRNLAVGLGILALLGVSSVLTIVWAERVRSIGRFQMEFAAGISHELRTPLTTIRTAAHNIASGVVSKPDEVREYADMLKREGRRLSVMVDQVIQFAQIESGRRQYERVPVDAASVVEQAIAVVFPSPEAARQRIRTEIEPGLPRVLADEIALTHSLENLISNALKYGAPGATCTLGAKWNPTAGAVELSVSNGGTGIETSDLPYVFDAFFRGHNVRHTPGNGMGLSLVKKMIENQNGRVSVHSEPNSGTTFTIHLPCAVPERPDGSPHPTLRTGRRAGAAGSTPVTSHPPKHQGAPL